MRARAGTGGFLVGGLVLSCLLGLQAPVAARPGKSPTAVVAVIDTGINPYHVTFRDDSKLAYRHPSTYIPGFPKSAQALRLTFDAKDYWTAVKKDCAKVWTKVEPGELYWFPGTKIVGAISFEQGVGAPNCAIPQPTGAAILDYGAHGTMTASRAASIEYGACKECRIVAVQGFANEAVSWTAENADWIDAQSNSWGRFLPLWDPALGGAGFWNEPEFVKTVEAAAQKHLSFWATGNGTLTRFGAVGHPTT
ncbi:MAG: S8 family serine peptidase, partial [Actinomycetota bacterium]